MNSSVVINYILFTGIFYLLYKVAFQQMKFFQWNRLLLLSIPLLSISIAGIAPRFQTPAALLNVTLPQIDITAKMVETSTSGFHFNWLNTIYITGTLIMGLIVVLGFIKIFRILKSAQPTKLANISYSVSDRAQNPFTFLTSIILPSSLSGDKNALLLLTHEEEHRRQKHTLDNIYYSFINVISWFNPFTHLLAKELRMVHETQADAQSLTQASHEEYARMLLSSTFGSPGLINRAVSPFFNSSFIKNRITMLYKKDNPRWMRINYALVLPIMTGMILFACNKVEEQVIPPPPPPKEALDFNKVDHPPLFKNCDVNEDKDSQKACFREGVLNYVGNNFKYPEKIKELGLEGKVYISFTIDENGRVKNPEIKRGLLSEDPQYQEAIEEAHTYLKEFVLNMPKMKPAIMNGKSVPVTFTLPMVFKLN